MLKVLYAERPKLLADFLINLGLENFGENVGVKFYQQEKKKASVPDGVIIQNSLGIYFETKISEWFDNNKLNKHLDSINAEKTNQKLLVALGNFESNRNIVDENNNICNNNIIIHYILLLQALLISLKRLRIFLVCQKILWIILKTLSYIIMRKHYFQNGKK